MIGLNNCKLTTSRNEALDQEPLDTQSPIYSYDFSTPKYKLILQGYGKGFESYSQNFFSQYRFTMTPKTSKEDTPSSATLDKDVTNEEGEEVFLRFKEELSKIDIESSEFLDMFPNPEEAIQLVEYLREEVKDPELRTIWSLLENLPSNLQEKVDLEEIDLLLAKQRKLSNHSKSSKRLDRFKVKTLDLGEVVVKK